MTNNDGGGALKASGVGWSGATRSRSVRRSGTAPSMPCLGAAKADRAAELCVASDVASPAMCTSVQTRRSVDNNVNLGCASARGLFAARQDPAS